jgi:hypothetical protein
MKSARYGGEVIAAIFKEAVDATSLTLPEIIRRAGRSERKLSGRVQNLRALLAGESISRSAIEFLARALDIEVSRLEEEFKEQDRKKTEAREAYDKWAFEPVNPECYYLVPTASFWGQKNFPHKMSRDEAIEYVRKQARGCRIVIPCFRAVGLAIMSDGRETHIYLGTPPETPTTGQRIVIK